MEKTININKLRPSETTVNNIVNYSTNIMIHVFIIFSFISIFFLFHISKISKKVLEDEIKHEMEENVPKMLRLIPSELTPSLQNVANNVDVNLVDKIYGTPDTCVNTYNNWLDRTMYSVMIYLFIILVIIVLLSFMFGGELHFNEILLENFIIFIFVALLEYGFFTYIASNYAPTLPSFVVTATLNSVKKNILS